MASIRFMSWNVTGIMSAASHLNTALTSHNIDICGISEHWLLEEQRHLFQSIHSDYASHVISDFSLHPLAHDRRRKGGVALLWRKDLSSRVTVIDSADDRIAILKLSLNSSVVFIMQVYLPTSRYGADTFSEYVAKLNEFCASFLSEGSVIIMGDLNARLSGPRINGYENSRGHQLQIVLNRHQLFAVTTSLLCNGPTHTYVHSDDGSSSLIDHLIIESSKHDLIKECRVLNDYYLDVSNHRPIICEMCFPVDIPTSYEQMPHTSFKWNSADGSDYSEIYRQTLQSHLVNSDICKRVLASEQDIERFTRDIASCLYAASESSLKKRKFRSFLKPYWKGELKALHKEMWRLRCVWVSNGRPRDSNSVSFAQYKEAKRKFRLKHRQLSESHLVNLNIELESAADLNQKSFWSMIKSRRSDSCGNSGAEMKFANIIVRDPPSLALHWGDYFSKMYTESSNMIQFYSLSRPKLCKK
ncbi:uncharacterized protein [Argopecten irradians]|uniref:uncharacterized protein n=1 Tax=Argopecten irradians TaxID=31199 RepID=UPI00371BB435